MKCPRFQRDNALQSTFCPRFRARFLRGPRGKKHRCRSSTRALFLILIAIAISAPAFGWAANTVPNSRYAGLARGVNLSGWFTSGGLVTVADLPILTTYFTSVRLPVDPRRLLIQYNSPSFIQQTFTDLDAALDMLIGAGLGVMLEMHADEAFITDLLSSPDHQAAFVQLWQTLGARYSSRDPEHLFFEIMNEPDYRFTPQAWNALETQALQAIRSQAPNHTVLVTSVQVSSLETLLECSPKFCSAGKLKLAARPDRLNPDFRGVPR